MSEADSELKVPPAAVRTPLSSPVVGSRLCPVCQKTPLTGAKTACSPACRRERSRLRRLDAFLMRVDRLEGLYQQAAEELQALRREVTGGRA